VEVVVGIDKKTRQEPTKEMVVWWRPFGRIWVGVVDGWMDGWMDSAWHMHDTRDKWIILLFSCLNDLNG
jgi:hypothetical protein